MRVLSIRQPFADQIIFGDKFCENRSWYTDYRGPLYIHASGGPVVDVPDDLLGFELRRGVILGCVELFGVVIKHWLVNLQRELFKRGRPDLDEGQLAYAEVLRQYDRSAWRHVEGEYCWILKNPRPLAEPVPAKGRLGIWRFELPVNSLVSAK